MVIGCTSTTGLGTNTSLIHSPNGLFGGKYTPTVTGGFITPRSGMLGGNYINLLNGMVLQWQNLGSGSVNSQTTTTTSWVFPVSFQTSCLYANAICFNNTASNVGFTSVGVTFLSSSSVTFAIGNGSNFTQSWTGIYVFALGY